MLRGAQVVGVGETLEQRRSFLLAHAHSRSNGGWGLLLVAHAGQTFQQRALSGRQVVQSTLIERRNPVEQEVKLILHVRDRFVSDQFVEHHRKARVSPRHPVERLQPGTHVIVGVEDVCAPIPIEIQPYDFDRFFEAQTLQDLNVEEIVKRLSNVGDSVEMQRCGGQQEATVVGHEKLAQRGDVILVAYLPGKDLAEVFQHDEQSAIALAIPLANFGYQRVDHLRVIFLRLHPLE